MDIIKSLAKRILPEIEKAVRGIVDDATKGIRDELKELKALAKALSGKPASRRGRPKGKRRKRGKLSKEAKARISRGLKKDWARRKEAFLRKSLGKKQKKSKRGRPRIIRKIKETPKGEIQPVEKPAETA